MEFEKEIGLLNKLYGKRVFNYNGPFFIYKDNILINFDFKLKFTGVKKMTKTSEFATVEVTVVKNNDKLSQLMFDGHVKMNLDLGVVRLLSDYIEKYYVSPIVDFYVEITDFKVDVNQNINESTMNRNVIRTVVRDVVNKVKSKESGPINLPEGYEEYSFTNFKHTFSVELYILHEDIDGFEVDGGFVTDIDVIEISIKLNPNNINKHMYELIGELNDVVAHELEHLEQEYRGELPEYEDTDDSFEYYTRPEEISAQITGFKRLSKLRKKPFEDTVINWFETHKDIHGLTDEEQKKVIEIIINGKSLQ